MKYSNSTGSRLTVAPGWFAYDETTEGEDVHQRLRNAQAEVCVPARKQRVYVMIGNEPFEECMKRIRQVIEWGAEPLRSTDYEI